MHLGVYQLHAQSRAVPDGSAVQQCTEILVENHTLDPNYNPNNPYLIRTYNCRRTAPAPGAPSADYRYTFAKYGNGEILEFTSTLFDPINFNTYSMNAYKWIIKTYYLDNTTGTWVFSPFMDVFQGVGQGGNINLDVDNNIPSFTQGNYQVSIIEYPNGNLNNGIPLNCNMDFYIEGNAPPLNISAVSGACKTCIVLNSSFKPINKCTNSWTGANQSIVIDWGDQSLPETAWSNNRAGGGGDDPQPIEFCKNLVPGVYNVQATEIVGDITNVSNVVQLTVYPPPTVTITASSNSYCSNLITPVELKADFQTQNPNNQHAFIWSTGETTSTIQVSPSVTTTYGVTVVDAVGCGIEKDVTINVIPNCCSGDITITDQKLSNFMAANPSLFINDGTYDLMNPTQNGKTIAINGILEIDKKFSDYSGRTFLMSPNASIKIASGAEFATEDNTFDPCGNEMWAGIYLVEGNAGSAKPTLSNYKNTFRQAKNALFVSGDVVLNGGRSTYENCHTGVILNNAGSQASSIGLDKFISNSNLLSPYQGRKPQFGIQSIVGDGVQITDCTFDNLICGVIIFGTKNAEILRGNTFKNIRDYENQKTLAAGSAICAWGGDVDLDGLLLRVETSPSKALENTAYAFLDCDRGITLWNYGAKIYNNRMHNVTKGVEAQQLKGKKLLWAEDNYLSNTLRGFHMTTFRGGTFVINQNDIRITPTPPICGFWNIGICKETTYGVLAENIAYSNLILSAASNNTITDATYGIWQRNMQHLMGMRNNDIRVSYLLFNQAQQDRAGIYSQWSQNASITDNHIRGIWPDKHFGVSLDRSTDYFLSCNSIGNLNVALNVVGNCAPYDLASIHENRFGDDGTNLGVGVRLSRIGGDFGYIGATVGDEKLANNNDFRATYSSGLHTYNATNSFGTDGAKFFIHPQLDLVTTSTFNPTFHGSNITNKECVTRFTLSDNDAEHQNDNCLYGPNNGLASWGGGEGYSEEELEKLKAIAEETATYPAFVDASKWLNEKQLYEKLDEKPDFKAQDVALNSFYNAKAVGDLGKIKEAEDKLSALSDTAISDIAQYQLLKMEWKNAIDAISTTSIYAEKAKFIYDMEYKLADLKPEDIAEGNKADINFLSEQCPYLVGSGVYKARTLRGLYEDAVDYNDKVICQSAGYFKTDAESATDDDRLPNEIAPEGMFELLNNPVADRLQYRYQLTGDSKGQLEVYDAMGRLVVEQRLEQVQGLAGLEVQKLSAGMYHISLRADNGFFKTHNFIKR